MRIFSEVETTTLSRDDLQKRRTTTVVVSNVFTVLPENHLPPRPLQYEKHLSSLDQVVEIPQDLDPDLLLPTNKPLAQAEELERVIPKSFLIVCRLAESMN